MSRFALPHQLVGLLVPSCLDLSSSKSTATTLRQYLNTMKTMLQVVEGLETNCSVGVESLADYAELNLTRSTNFGWGYGEDVASVG